MILAPKDDSVYTRVLCIKDNEFIDKAWGDCSVKDGQWYYAIIDERSSVRFPSLINEEWILVKFRNGLCPYERKMFKTESQIREEKIQSILNGDNDEYCYYSNLPSPMSYMKKNNE
jgi:hypothetical protein